MQIFDRGGRGQLDPEGGGGNAGCRQLASSSRRIGTKIITDAFQLQEPYRTGFPRWTWGKYKGTNPGEYSFSIPGLGLIVFFLF